MTLLNEKGERISAEDLEKARKSKKDIFEYLKEKTDKNKEKK